MNRDHLKRLLVLCTTVLLGASVTACGNASKSTAPASRAAANATANGNTNPNQEHILENTPYDSDKDTDGAHPDEDDNGKPPTPDSDNDGDGTTKTRYDSDDKRTLDFGHAADAANRKLITTLIEHYYAIAAAEDGTTACSMVYSTIAEAAPEDYGTSPPGPAFAKGTTCPAVLTNIFKHYHNQIITRLPNLKISRIRINERQGTAILDFPTSEREISVKREGHTWKMLSVIDNELS
jgi:hypothetical protein